MDYLTSAQLVKITIGAETPFGLRLASDFEPGASQGSSNDNEADLLIVNKVLRLVPGKRLVAKSTWRGHEVIAKLFFQKHHWERHFKRECAGLRLTNEAKLLTPKLLGQGNLATGNGSCIITEDLVDALPLGELTAEAGQLPDKLMDQMLKLVAQCHDFGIWQQDIHLDNFLCSANQLYIIDAAEIRHSKTRTPLDHKARMDNLALLFSQFPVSNDQQLDSLMAQYNLHCSKEPLIKNTHKLDHQLIAARRKRLEKYRRKLMRTSTAHQVKRSTDCFAIFDRALDGQLLTEFMQTPDQLIAQGILLKDGNTSTVAQITRGNKSYVVKRYNIKGFWHLVTRQFGRRRALNSWCASFMLNLLGISVPRSFIVMERRHLRWIVGESYLLCELAAGSRIDELVRDSGTDPITRQSIIDVFREFFYVMQRSRLSHGDCKATNFIFGPGRLTVLDLDAVKFHKTAIGYKRDFRKDLGRFARNWHADESCQAFNSEVNRLVATFES